MQQKVAVIIPCYNESQTIQKVVLDFKAALPEAEIYVYDNNSVDGSAELAKSAGAVVFHEYRQGKGNVIRSMFRQLDADCYLMVDADDTYPAAMAQDLIAPILSGQVDMVVGDRLSSTYFSENKRKFHNFGNMLVRSLINRIFKSEVKDILSGYRAFNRAFVKNFPIGSTGFEIETEMTIHALDKNFSILEIPVQYRDRPANSISKLNTFGDGYKVILTIVNLYKNLKPLAFFGLLAALGTLVAVVLIIPILFEYFNTGLVPRFPTLITAGVIFTISLLSLVCGIILDTVSKNSKSFYELLLNRWYEDHQG
ncbi:MAG: glycosyltransferase [Anaerolineaceae bacterium]|nr:glycosyltransferase [Anaerolineaceae bacterium]